MGGPEKSQWITTIIIKASTDVCEDHNHLQSEIIQRIYVQALEKPLLLLSSSPHSKKKKTSLLDQGDRTTQIPFIVKRSSQRYGISSH